MAEHRRRMDGHGIVEQDGLGVGDADERRKRMPRHFIVETNARPYGYEVHIAPHAMNVSVIVDFHEIAIRDGEEAEMAHVVVGFFDKSGRLRFRHFAGRNDRECEQALPVGRIRFAEWAKGGQQRLGVHAVGQPEREKKVRYAEIMVC